MNSNLVSVDQEIEDENFGIASFSIDPRKDTPEVLKAYEKQYGITNPNWNLMTGDRDAIYDLARTGFTIYAEENPEVPGGFEHSGYFALVDQEGYLRSRKDEFGNVIIFYRGSVPQGIDPTQADEEPQIDILIEDIKILLDHGNKN
jgi:protein SCO1/2